MDSGELDRLLNRLQASMEASHRVNSELIELVRMFVQEDEGRARQPVQSQPPAPQKSKGPLLLDTRSAANRMNLSRRTLEKWRWEGGGPPFIKIGGGVRYDSAELEAWLSTRRRRSTSDPGPSK